MYQLKNSHKTFLYRSKKYCKSFKSFRELGKKIFSNKFLQMAISPSAKNGMILTAPYSEVSSAITDLFYQSYFNTWGTCSKKVWMYMMLGLGFMVILKKVLFACHTNMVAPNGVLHLTITSPLVDRLCSSRRNYRRCQSPHKGCRLALTSKLTIRKSGLLSK